MSTTVTAVPDWRVPALDGLRGWLALVVLCRHGLTALYPAVNGTGPEHFGFDRLVDRSPAAVLLAADFAVRIFFVHSGFVLALKFFRTGDRRWPASMLVRRAIRLGVPILAAVMVGYLLLQWLPTDAAAMTQATGARQRTFDPGFGDAARDGLYGAMLLGRDNVPGAWWTMPIELYCSLWLLASLAVFGGLPRRRLSMLAAAYVAAVVLAAIAWADIPGIDYGDLWGFAKRLAIFSSAFVAGAVLAARWSARPAHALFPAAPRGVRGVITLLCVGVGVFPTVVRPFTFGRGALLQLASIVAAAGVAAWDLSSPRTRSVLERPLSRWLGRLSFAVYLLHLAVQRTIMNSVFLALLDRDLPYNAAAPLAFGIGLAATFGIAHVLFGSIDRFALTFGKSWIQRRLGLHPAQPALGSPSIS
ncbi:MAG: acyltransferase [Actinobacteria bacterium]|nr:acyltransferase [Actinomycetota bacterium]